MSLDLIISADSHSVEPFDLWEKTLGAKYGDKVPHLIKSYKGKEGRFFACPGPAGVEPFSVEGTAVAEAASPEESEELRVAGYDPVQRERCLDKAGVAAEVIYPTFGLFILGSEDAEVKRACCEVYNDWIAEFCSQNLKKFCGIAMIPLEDVDWAVKELERVAKKGLKGAMIPITPKQGLPLYHESYYDRFWASAQALGIPITLHAITGRAPDPLAFFDASKRKLEGPRRFIELFQEIGPTLADIVCGGVLDRYPELRLVSCEHEVSWLPYFMFRLDQIQKDFSYILGVNLKKKASEYLRENLWSTVIDDPFALSVRYSVGVDRIMWSSDFPHPRCVYLNTREMVEELFKDLPAKEKQKIISDNAIKLYRLTVDKAAVASAH